MIIYKNSSQGFMHDVDTNQITDRIKQAYYEKSGKTRFNPREDMSWRNSLIYMERVLRRSGVPSDCGVLIEFGLPSTSKRIDFIVSGQDATGSKKFIIIELKQWTEAESTSTQDLVKTPYYRDYTTHPSYQAKSYKGFLSDFNENVYTKKLIPYSCAYLHNYTQRHPEPLNDPIYQEIVSDTPIYFKDDYEKLEKFLCDHVGHGNGMDIMYEIDSGNIRPSKQLVDHVVGLFKGNMEFHLIDEQKVTYEVALERGLNSTGKTVILVNGGPGTGKSVVSMSLLGGFLKKRKNVFFAAPNASFREVMLNKLVGGRDGSRAKHLITGSGRYVNDPVNTYDIIVVDEAHRLKNNAAFMYQGENQVEDIVNAANVSIFFVDDDQSIRPEDIGTVSEIRRVADLFGAEIVELELATQFRCSGADGYVNWLNDVLDIRETGNFDDWDKEDFEFRIAETPGEMREWVNEHAAKGFNARILAGYAWPWTGVKEGNSDAQVPDVSIPDHDFAMPWNSRKVGSSWAISKKGLGQIGCVHTAQGLEFDYVGVIVGDDLKYAFLDEEKVESGDLFDDAADDPTDYPGRVYVAADEGETYQATAIPQGKFFSEWSAYHDAKGKQGLQDDPDNMCKMIRNIYRILMTRGMKGCCVYFTNKPLGQYFRDRLEKTG